MKKLKLIIIAIAATFCIGTTSAQTQTTIAIKPNQLTPSTQTFSTTSIKPPSTPPCQVSNTTLNAWTTQMNFYTSLYGGGFAPTQTVILLCSYPDGYVKTCSSCHAIGCMTSCDNISTYYEKVSDNGNGYCTYKLHKYQWHTVTPCG